ncbi:DUF881 domain-containing protein [Anaerovibrio sp.]|uniref:DUF881 domain-containing protein n=1 Tax=Anaerovibrio sp. TaxID=1872532 RepID=UPI003F165EDC
MHIEKGRLSIACVCMVLGFMLAVQFRTTQDIKATTPLQRVEVLTERLQNLEAENDDLRSELQDLKSSAVSGSGGKLSEDMLMMSGGTALEGPGIIVTIDDSAKGAQELKKADDPNLYLVHDEDLLKVVNELRAAGAEAISLNGQRLTANSEIRCAGPTVSVNNVRSAPPFEIRAIGNIKDLENAINMRGGVADTLKVWGIHMELASSEKVWIPAYKNAMRYKYAAAAAEQEAEK